MKLIDITRELFGACVYPGDPSPEYERLQEIGKGDSCNLTYLKMCVHNGTHMDAPRHFVEEGKSIEELPLEQVMGRCSVLKFDGMLDGETARKMAAGKEKKILWKGRTIFTEEAAQVFVDLGVELVGVESQTVGQEEDPAAVHEILLGAGIAILEGLYLEAVCVDETAVGTYFLCAQPLKLKDCDGAPCRAVLIEW